VTCWLWSRLTSVGWHQPNHPHTGGNADDVRRSAAQDRQCRPTVQNSSGPRTDPVAPRTWWTRALTAFHHARHTAVDRSNTSWSSSAPLRWCHYDTQRRRSWMQWVIDRVERSRQVQQGQCCHVAGHGPVPSGYPIALLWVSEWVSKKVSIFVHGAQKSRESLGAAASAKIMCVPLRVA